MRETTCQLKKNSTELLVLSDTRWLSRVDSIHCLLKHYRSICEAFEAIKAQSVGTSASDANGLLQSLISF